MERWASGARGESRGVLDGIVHKDLYGGLQCVCVRFILAKRFT
jgi:hypothetical protein